MLNVCCFTGHRDLPRDNIIDIKVHLKKSIEHLIVMGVDSYIVGGAVGFDMLAAYIVLGLKQRYNHIRLTVMLPCEDYDLKWNLDDKKRQENILNCADKIVYVSNVPYFDGCMLKRNQAMVDSASHCIAYLTKPNGGTLYTVKYARKKGLYVYNIADVIR